MASLEADPDARLRHGILTTCFGRYDGELANRDKANNKIDLEKLLQAPEYAALAVAQVARLAREHHPDLLVPVANGANWLGREAALSLGIDCMLMDKDEETKELSLRRNAAQTYGANRRIVIVEDVLRTGTSVGKTLSLPTIGERAEAVVSVWDRGDVATRPDLLVPVISVITEHIPAHLPPDSPYWDYVI